MRLRENDKLAYIAKCANRPIAELSHSIAQILFDNDLIQDDEDCYGHRLTECINEDAPVIDVVDMLKSATGLDEITCDVFDAFRDCVLMGDGDCPICGGKLDYECQGHDVCNGYDNEPDFVADYQKWQCPLCGYVTDDEC